MQVAEVNPCCCTRILHYLHLPTLLPLLLAMGVDVLEALCLLAQSLLLWLQATGSSYARASVTNSASHMLHDILLL